jgi:hypothetical protein
MELKEILNSLRNKTTVSNKAKDVIKTEPIKIDLNNLQFTDFQWILGERQSIYFNYEVLNVSSYFHDTGSTSYGGDTQTITCDNLSFNPLDGNLLKDVISDSLIQDGKAEKIYHDIHRKYSEELREDGYGLIPEDSWDKSEEVDVKVESTIIENTGNVELIFSIRQPNSQDEWKKYLSTTGTYKNEGYVFKFESIPEITPDIPTSRNI